MERVLVILITNVMHLMEKVLVITDYRRRTVDVKGNGRHWGIRLNAGKTKTMILFRSRTMHSNFQCIPTSTPCGTVLYKRVLRDILGVSFDADDI